MPRKPGRPRTSRTYRFPDDLMAAIEAAAKEVRRPVTTEIEIAMEKHLAELGRWPPGVAPGMTLPGAIHRTDESVAREEEPKKSKKPKK